MKLPSQSVLLVPYLKPRGLYVPEPAIASLTADNEVIFSMDPRQVLTTFSNLKRWKQLSGVCAHLLASTASSEG